MRGGQRQGAGRKKGSKASHTLEAQEARAYIIQQVGASLEVIIRGLIKKAASGDVRAAQSLFERAYGRPYTPEGEPAQQVVVTVIKYASATSKNKRP